MIGLITEISFLRSLVAAAAFIALAYAGSFLIRRKTGRLYGEQDGSGGLLLPWKWSLTSLSHGVVSGIGIFLLVSVLGALLVWTFPIPEHPVQRFFRNPSLTSYQIVLLFLSVGLIAPLSEEAFFRGFLLPALGTKWGIPVARHLSAIIFGMMHFDPYRFIPLYIAGFILGRGAIRDQSLATAVIGHAVWNLCGVSLLWLGTWGGLR